MSFEGVIGYTLMSSSDSGEFAFGVGVSPVVGTKGVESFCVGG